LHRYNTSVVVIAPNQVHTNDENAIKVIYDRHAVKTSFYANMGSWKGVKSTLGILDYPTAAATRNNLIKCFQSRNLDVLSEHIDSHVTDFVNCIAEHIKQDKPTEGLFWFRLLAIDIVTDVLWGEQTNLLSDARTGEVNSAFLRRFHAFSKYNALRSFIPGLDTFVVLFGSKKWRTYRADLNDLDVTAVSALKRWEKARASGEQQSHEKDVLTMLGNLNDHEDPAKRIRSDDIPAYLVEMLAAGSSTTSTTAALCCHELALNQDLQTQLHQELVDVFPDAQSVTLAGSQEIPLLRAVVRETMRLYPVIPGPLERKLGNPCSFQSQKIVLPPGVIGSGSAFTQSRQEDVYKRAAEWLPARWLENSDEQKDARLAERMRQNWMPFGTGSRSCPGSNLALNELHLMLAATFRRFRVHLPKETQNVKFESGHIQMVDHFTSAPAIGSIWVRFEERLDL
jgi:cytochrome P450